MCFCRFIDLFTHKRPGERPERAQSNTSQTLSIGPVTEATTNVGLQQEFSSNIVTDLSVGYKFTDALTLTVGANNLLDVYPDRAAKSISYVDGNGQTQTGDNRSEGRFDWSRRAQQFGIGGRFLFARVAFTLE
jgi:iron complex outermembrane receptor protein